MPIEFGPEKWDRIRRTYAQWWAGELERPLIEALVANRDPGRPEPHAPILCQGTCSDLSIPAADLIDRLDYELSKRTWLADAYPQFCMDVFGPGVGAAFAGAKLDTSTGQVWFHSPYPEGTPLSDMHIEYQPGNVWLERVKEICAAAMDRWQGQVLMSMADLGGNLDIVQSFTGAERLLMALYDEPEEVLRLLDEEHALWHRVYAEINDVLQPVNPGYGDWSGIYSDRPSYILQCDFCYMIGPEQFRRFVAPELSATCKRLDRTIYHLDGPGQIPHLDQLLAMDELDGIQWVSGAGSPGQTEWPEIRRKIGQSGKKAQTFGSLDDLATIIEQAGTSRGIHHRGWVAPDANGGLDGARRQLSRFGIED